MISRDYKSVPLDGNPHAPHRVTITYAAEPCAAIGQQARRAQQELMDFVTNNPGMLDCGHELTSLSMTHNGERWVVKLVGTSFASFSPS